MSIYFMISYILLWMVVIVQFFAVLGLIKIIGKLSRNSQHAVPNEDGPETLVGKRAPAFQARDIAGRVQTIAGTASQTLVTLLFVSPNCPLCSQALSNLEGYASRTRNNLLVICYGTAAESQRIAMDFEIGYPVISDQDGDIFELYRVKQLPVAVQVSSDGTVLTIGREGDANGVLSSPLAYHQA